jgi:hypothetical protein
MKLGKNQQAIIDSLKSGAVDSIRSESLTGKYREIIAGEMGEYVSTSSMDGLVWNHRELFNVDRVNRWNMAVPETEYSMK